MHQFKGNPTLNTQTSTQLTTHSNDSLLCHNYTQEHIHTYIYLAHTNLH